jgi:hypothetical protein
MATFGVDSKIRPKRSRFHSAQAEISSHIFQLLTIPAETADKQKASLDHGVSMK